MTGTAVRLAAAASSLALLAAPASALAAKRHHRAHKTQAPAVTVVVPHDYDAGGNGAPLETFGPGTRVNLFDPLQLATTLGPTVLSQLGLPPLPQI